MYHIQVRISSSVFSNHFVVGVTYLYLEKKFGAAPVIMMHQTLKSSIFLCCIILVNRHTSYMMHQESRHEEL